MSNLTTRDILELQVAISLAIAGTNDNTTKTRLRAERDYFQRQKAALIAAANEKLVEVLSPRIARLEEIIRELRNAPALLLKVGKFKDAAGLPDQPAHGAVSDLEPNRARGRTVEDRYGLTKQVLVQIQETLAGRGIYRGPINGLYDSDTRAAIRGFQRTQGLNDDGIPGPKTQDRLWPEPIEDRLDPIEPKPPAAPATQPAANAWPDEAGVPAFFGRRKDHQTRLHLPFSMKLAWNRRQRISSFFCHEKVHDPLDRIFRAVLAEYGESRIRDLGLDIFSGCLNERRKVGGTSWSMHSWGIAVDIDNQRNRLRWNHTKAQLAKPEYEPFWRIVESEGAVSLGRIKDYDWMHFQFARP